MRCCGVVIRASISKCSEKKLMQWPTLDSKSTPNKALGIILAYGMKWAFTAVL